MHPAKSLDQLQAMSTGELLRLKRRHEWAITHKRMGEGEALSRAVEMQAIRKELRICTKHRWAQVPEHLKGTQA